MKAAQHALEPLPAGDGQQAVAVRLAAAAGHVGHVPGQVLAVLQQPAVLFLLSFEQAEQDLLETGGASCPELLFDSGFQGGIMDFDVHRGFLVLW